MFGAFVPGMSPIFMRHFIREGTGIVVPAQMFFGPAAMATYLWLRRRGPERSMREWLASAEAPDRPRARARRQTSPAPQPAR